jgi:asparagine synthase (glutamine-hydrolysing)
MANGLEVRPPFLDHELLELAARIPSHFKVREGKTKWIVKEAYRQQLPAEILGRRKQGFELPIDVWLRKPLREMFEDSVLAGNGPVRGLIDPAVVRRLFTAHGRGTGRHGHLLWSILVLARWGERHLGRSRRNVTGERRAIHVEV